VVLGVELRRLAKGVGVGEGVWVGVGGESGERARVRVVKVLRLARVRNETSTD
jgi:hypothetical protein